MSTTDWELLPFAEHTRPHPPRTPYPVGPGPLSQDLLSEPRALRRLEFRNKDRRVPEVGSSKSK
jgi:hypothetical protein